MDTFRCGDGRGDDWRRTKGQPRSWRGRSLFDARTEGGCLSSTDEQCVEGQACKLSWGAFKSVTDSTSNDRCRYSSRDSNLRFARLNGHERNRALNGHRLAHDDSEVTTARMLKRMTARVRGRGGRARAEVMADGEGPPGAWCRADGRWLERSCHRPPISSV
jgi:hypothetical protein